MIHAWAATGCGAVAGMHQLSAHTSDFSVGRTAVTEMNYHSYPIPIPAALDQMPADFKNDPLFNVPASYTDGYQYILNPSPQLVNARTKIYQEFKAA